MNQKGYSISVLPSTKYDFRKSYRDIDTMRLMKNQYEILKKINYGKDFSILPMSMLLDTDEREGNLIEYQIVALLKNLEKKLITLDKEKLTLELTEQGKETLLAARAKMNQ